MKQLATLACTVATATTAVVNAETDWRAQFPVMTFGLATGENQQSASRRWGAMAPYLASCLGIEEVVVRIGNDYSAIIESLIQGDIQLAWLGPAQYAIAYDMTDGDLTPFAVDVSLDGDLGFRWTVVVRADSPFETLEDLEGASLGWPSPTSTSGFVLPMQYFRERGWVSADNDPIFFDNLVQTGSHDNSLIAVVQGTIDAATNWYYSPTAGAHTRAAASGTISLDDIRFIHESGLVPGNPFATRLSYPAEMRAKLSECFVNLKYADPEVWAAVSEGIFGGFALISHEAYAPFVELRREEMSR